MNYSPETQKPKRKVSSAVIAIIVCSALIVSSIVYAVLNPNDILDLIPSLIGDVHSKTHYSDMEYTRPDTDGLIADIDSLITMINEGKSFNDQRPVFNKINTELNTFYTMSALANIRYATDATNEFYKEEDEFLNTAYVTISNKTNALLDAIAFSTFKTNYERSYFSVGYFNDWKPRTHSDEVVALMEQEQALINEYTHAISNAFVEINGQKIILGSDEFYALNDSNRAEAVNAYYYKYNEQLGKIYIDLIKIRKQIAEKLDVDYLEYAYSNFDRDYTPEQTMKYLDGIAKNIIPLLNEITIDTTSYDTYADPITSFYALSRGAKNMGGTIAEAFDYMFEYGLFEFSYSENKQDMSFETFLPNYYAPFIFSSPQKNVSDFLTFSHEFGHFVDDYYNVGAGSTLEAAESASQAMAYILPFYTNSMMGFDGKDFLKMTVSESVDMYTSQAFITRFEHMAYQLSSNELTLDALNELAYDAATEFGYDEQTAQLYRLAWFSIQHIYIYPGYTISYIISNDVSLQILDAELKEPGKGGVKAFTNLIDRDDDLTFTEDVTSSGFESPFADGRTVKIADFIKSVLGEAETEELPSASETPAA